MFNVCIVYVISLCRVCANCNLSFRVCIVCLSICDVCICVIVCILHNINIACAYVSYIMCVNMCYVCVLYMRAVRRKGIQKHIFIMFIIKVKKSL